MNKKNNRKLKITMFIIIVFIIIAKILGLDHFVFTLQGASGTCSSIKQSIERNLFLKKYRPIKEVELFNGNIINFDEIWLEKLWVYSNDDREPILDTLGSNKYQVVISSHFNGFANYLKEWYISDFYPCKPDKDRIVGEFSYIPEDTLVLRIVKKNSNSGLFEDDSVNAFVFVNSNIN